MKLVQYLLIFYAFFIILIGPALHIAGSFFNVKLISNRDYFIVVLLFLAALAVYTKKEKKTV